MKIFSVDPHRKDSTRLPWGLPRQHMRSVPGPGRFHVSQSNHSCGVCAPEPRDGSYGAQDCNYLSPSTLEPVLYSKKSRFSKKATGCTPEQPPLPTTGGNACSNEDPAQPEINK